MKQPRIKGQIKALAPLPALLIKAGHNNIEFSSLVSQGPFERQKPYLWFWSAGFIFLRYDNRPISIKWEADTQRWKWRKNRGAWYFIGDGHTDPIEKWMSREMVRRLDDVMLGDDDEGQQQGLHERTSSPPESGSQGLHIEVSVRSGSSDPKG